MSAEQFLTAEEIYDAVISEGVRYVIEDKFFSGNLAKIEMITKGSRAELVRMTLEDGTEEITSPSEFLRVREISA